MKILLYDLETTPNLAYVWGKFEQNVIAFEKEWEILCFAYKWYGEKEVQCFARDGKDDYTLLKRLYKLFKEADVIIAHNGDNFDQKKVNARLIYHGFSPPKIMRSIDTKKIAKRYFAFNSNSLNDLGTHLGLGKKVETGGFELWRRCMLGCKKSWKKMMKYNKQDVVLLEKVYKKFLPWIQDHPNVAKVNEVKENKFGICPNCGSAHVWKGGIRASNMQLRQQWQCKTCKSWFLTKYVKEK